MPFIFVNIFYLEIYSNKVVIPLYAYGSYIFLSSAIHLLSNSLYKVFFS
jgi:hypothetical protein